MALYPRRQEVGLNDGRITKARGCNRPWRPGTKLGVASRSAEMEAGRIVVGEHGVRRWRAKSVAYDLRWGEGEQEGSGFGRRWRF